MIHKLNNKESDFKGYNLFLIVSNLRDYQLAHFINLSAHLDLKKYEDMPFATNNNKVRYYSWFHYNNRYNNVKYYLLENVNDHNYLFSNLKKIDFLLFINGAVNEKSVAVLEQNLRKIRGITAVFRHEISVLKNIQMFLDEMELHELENVIKKS